MAEKDRYPTLDEFWKRLDLREVEPDLIEELKKRTSREQGEIGRAGPEELIVAVAARIVPGDVPAKALAVELDKGFDKQAGRADDKAGLMPRGELVPTGFRVIDEESHQRFGKKFAEASSEQQDQILTDMEKGNVKGPAKFDSATWFKRVRDSYMTAFGSDPRGMVQMGFPGPSYKPGHVWLGKGAVKARAKRKRGYMEL